VISVRNLNKTYLVGKVSVEAVRDASFDISEGEFVIIHGNSGSGKSTILHLLGLLDEPTKGIIILNKKNVSKLPESEKSKIRLQKMGYIFQEYFKPYHKPHENEKYDPLATFKKASKYKITNSIKYSILAVAPAIVLHELAHKFVGLAFGVPSTFYASYGFLILGIVLKLVGSPFLFFVPGFVSHPSTTPFISSLIAVSGPLTNLMLWGIAIILIKNNKKFNFSEKTIMVLGFMRKINIFLFFFNILPIPPFDGYQFFAGILSLL